ncbi:tetratricopeptide repeat protein [Sphingomonas sp.]|uniref:tetratricopeptide repeat protein n=1 Tax=Sphingomonas sp. TaxID=28214 RepID=UPI0035BC3FE3
MGFAALVLIAGLAAAALWLLGIAGPLWRLVGAAAMLGAAGYAWQGSPTLAGHPVAADSQRTEVDPGLVAFRAAIMPGEPGDAAVLSTADRRLQDGDAGQAARVLLAAIAERPRDAALWTALGTTLAAHDAQTLSPSARFAFARAFRLAPDSPGPPFFLGLVQVQAGEIAAARPAWQQALALTPQGAPWRADIAERLTMVDQFLAMQSGRTR